MRGYFCMTVFAELYFKPEKVFETEIKIVMLALMLALHFYRTNEKSCSTLFHW